MAESVTSMPDVIKPDAKLFSMAYWKSRDGHGVDRWAGLMGWTHGLGLKVKT